MEIVNFYPKTFHQIQEQDNPAFDDQECLMLVRECPPYSNSNRVLVLYIAPNEKPLDNETVTSVAVFWNENIALLFCESFKPEIL